ncbi:MAG: hypothetical protein HY716_16180 [Planctomycetes bacterium]|nr:hypothetical protein [Planctomycetota bacterium]
MTVFGEAPMSGSADKWGRKGATLSDKTACEEFGLTRDEIYRAIRAGTLQYREASMHGNPWLRLLRREVEAVVKKKHGRDYLEDQKTKTELNRITRELKRLKSGIAALEKRKSELQAGAAEGS